MDALEHQRNSDTPTNAVEDATWFLAELLVYSDGLRMPSSGVREHGEAAGYSWRTMERAAAVLGIEKAKSANTWFWRLPVRGGEQGAPTRTDEGEDRRRPNDPPRATPMPNPQDRLSDQLAQAIDLLARLTDRVERLEAAIVPRPAPTPKRAPSGSQKPQRAVPDFRRRATQPGRWGAPGLVRCLDCHHAQHLMDTGGYCKRAGLQMRWLWARRTCLVFEADEE